MMRFSVQDTGVGISDTLQEKIFDPYTQEKNPNIVTSSFHSTGLGLTICKGFVELMGGSIHLKSQLGKGSTFWFDIPLKIDIEKQQYFESRHHYLKGINLGVCNMPLQHAKATSVHFVSWGMNVTHLNVNELHSPASSSLDLLIFMLTRTVDYDNLISTLGEPQSKILFLLPPGIEQPPLPEDLRGNIHFLRVPAGAGNFHEALVKLATDQNLQPASESSVVEAPASQTILTVLVVEDNLVNQKVVEAMLQKMGCEVLITDNGRAGLQKIR